MLKISKNQEGDEIVFKLRIPNGVTVSGGKSWERLKDIMEMNERTFINVAKGFLDRAELFGASVDEERMQKEREEIELKLAIKINMEQALEEHKKYIKKIQKILEGNVWILTS